MTSPPDTATAAQAAVLTLTDPAVIACPHAAYHRLQREAPVFRDPVTGFYEVTRAADVRTVMTDTEKFSNRFNLQSTRSPALQEEVRRLYATHGFPTVPTLLDNDPPHHRAVRSLVDKAFMPKRIALIEPAIHAEVDHLIDRVIDSGTMEFIADFAVPLPVTLISDQLGVPRSERAVVKAGSDAMMATANPLTPDDELVEMTMRVIRLQQLIADRIGEVRRHPDETLLSAVVNGYDDGDADLGFLVSIFQSVLIAGNETTAHALGNIVKLLADDPAALAAIADDPARARRFVEEGLRLHPPGQGFFRVVAQDVEMGGVVIPRGATVVPRRAAADIDETVFDHPLRFDPDRRNVGAHLAFGVGPHFCIGHLLARAEMRISVETIARRMATLSVADEPDAYVRKLGLLDSGVSRLRLVFTRRAGEGAAVDSPPAS